MLNKTIIDKYKEKNKELRMKDIRFFIILIIISLVIAIPFVFFYSDGVWAIAIFWTFIGLAGLFIIILVLILIDYSSSIPFYNYLYPMIIDDINSEAEDTITYESGIKKEQKEFSMFEKRSGLFIKAARRHTNFKLNYSKQNIEILAADIRVFSEGGPPSGGKIQTNHFEGTYFVFFTNNSTNFQLRQKKIGGKSRHKKVEMKEINTRDDIKEFIKDTGSGFNYIEKKYYDLYDFLKLENGNVYISGLPGEIHVAFMGYNLEFPKQIGIKTISIDSLLEAKHRLVDIINYSDKILEIIK